MSRIAVKGNMFDCYYFESLPDDPMLATLAVCDAIVAEDDRARHSNRTLEGYDWYIEALGVLWALIEAYSLPFPPPPPLGGNQETNIDTICQYVSTIRPTVAREVTHTALRTTRDRFISKFKATFAYEFSDGDLKRIQTVLNELRDLVAASEVFDANHKQRILRKLESLQSEFHKRVASLDKFWGLIGEAGVALGKFGKEAKPFVDRVKEIAQIVWRTQARAEELPSGTPLPLLTDTSRGERLSHEE